MTNLELKNVFKSYDNKNFAVKNVSFSAHDGEFVVLIGPSGCGKSTILNLIAGLENLTSGELFFDGMLANLTPVQNRNVAMVFQNYALYPHMSVYENIAFPLRNQHCDKKNIKQSVLQVAKLLDIEDQLNKKFNLRVVY